MARENQGLQIALIGSVMLTIILGGMTYYWYRQYEDADTKGKTYFADAQKKDQLAKESAKEVSDLKERLGVPDTEKVDTIKNTLFKEDMNKYAAAYPDEKRFYRPLLEMMQKTIDDRNAELADAKTQIQGLQGQIKVFEASKQPQIDDFQKARDAAGEDLASERSKFNAERERITQDEARLQAESQSVRKEKETDKTKYEGKLSEAGVRARKLTEVVERQAEKIETLTSTKIDVFDGEIRWVDQRANTVWINVGRADALPRQITFGVYPAKTTDLAGSGRKASIEVAQILGDHLAEARILDDTITDPIIPGDKIHTPLWAPGEKKHFALAGYMDVNGDGKNNLKTVMDLIKMNDGVVDSWVDEKGNVEGAITVNTRYLILGQEPTDKGFANEPAANAPAQIAAFVKMVGNARRLGIQQLPLGDLLQRIGWKNRTPVVRYGLGANPKDFAPKPEEGLQKKSSGNVSDLFKPRQPPGRAPATAY